VVGGMLLHGILHRVEAGSGNARVWVGDVHDAVETEGVSNGEVTLMEFVWGDIARETDGEKLEEMEWKELEKELQWCLGKLGEGGWEDASETYARHGKRQRRSARKW
jgi:hypothetical protein